MSDIDNILEKERIKNSRLSLVAFVLGLLPIVYIICITVKDMHHPIDLNANNEELMRNTVIEFGILTVTGIIGILIATVSLFKNRCSKKLGVWTIILNSIIPILVIGSTVLVLINIFILKK